MDKRSIQGVHFLRLHGNAVERGRAHGVLLKTEIQDGALPALGGVGALLTTLAGVALPAAGRAWHSAARAATRERLAELARASLEFVRDVGRAPESVEDLLVRPERVEGWLGPYVAIEAVDPAGGHPAALDAWTRPIRIARDPADAIRGVFARSGADVVER